MRSLTPAVLIAGLISCTLSFGQPKKGIPDLSLILEPGPLVDGVPQTFTFRLTNISARDLLIPRPNIGCSEPTAAGNLWMKESWQPLAGKELGNGVAYCDFGYARKPPPTVLELARNWTRLQPGESISITATNRELRFETQGPGKYSFLGEYLPPAMSEADLQMLNSAGIAVPQTKTISGSLQYQREALGLNWMTVFSKLGRCS